MTTTLTAPRAPHTQHGTRRAPIIQATIEVEGMDRGVRGDVEKLMLLLPEPELSHADIWDTVWCTRWRRQADGRYRCRESVRATRAELAEFERELARLAEAENFVARVRQRPYHGAHG